MTGVNCGPSGSSTTIKRAYIFECEYGLYDVRIMIWVLKQYLFKNDYANNGGIPKLFKWKLSLLLDFMDSIPLFKQTPVGACVENVYREYVKSK